METVDVLEAFADVLAHVDADTSYDEFYGRLCEVTCRLARMDRAVIFRYDETRRRVRAVGTHGLDLDLFARAQVTVDTAPIARQALAEDRVVEADGADVRAVPDAYRDLVADSRLACAPMVAAGRWIGVILCDRAMRPGRDAPGDAPSAELTAGERSLLATLGKVAALATRARLATHQQEQARRLQDRVDLARDVHDRVIQRLFGVSMALAADAPLDDAARRRAADEVQEAMTDLRQLLGRPLEEQPPPDTTLAEEAARLGVSVRGDAGVPPGRERLAQSVLAEAVRNARKHASPTGIEVEVRDVEGAWVMEVSNDGVSGRPSHPPGMGLRLAALEALQVGGLVEFGPADAGRWRVRLAVPRD